MSITINSNIAASTSSLNLKRASERLSKSLQRLSSGNRIINASDDAGGLAVAMKLQSSLRRATASMNNTQNGVSFLQMQDSVLKIAGDIIDRMAELKSYFNDISKNALDRETYNHEFHELQKELNSLRRQKFNGVSLFATNSPDRNNLKIITSDDGLGEKIELARVGLFENFKSKYGQDGVLNSGSHGEYRQLVGDFSTDAGILDANPGYASRDYKKGEIVFRNGPMDADSGYFMALKDVYSGAKVEDTSDVNSNWIRIADKAGKGFSEAYPDAEIYDHNSLKFNSKGESMAYLKGDVIKVQAHWNDPNSSIFIKALADVPRKISLNDILLEGIGEGKYFDFIGVDRTNDDDGKPTSAYVMPNSNHATPEKMADGDTALLRSIVSLNSGNYYTPTFAQVGEVEPNGALPSIYQPTQNWGIKQWSNDIFKYGDIVYDQSADDSSFIKSISESVKGIYLGASYASGDYVKSNGDWFKAYDEVDAQDKPVSDASAHQNTAVYEAGDNISIVDNKGIERIYRANANVKGAETKASLLNNGDVVTNPDVSGNAANWYKLQNLDQAKWVSDDDDLQAKINDGTISQDSLVYNQDSDRYIVVTNFVTGTGDTTFQELTTWADFLSKGFSAVVSTFTTPSSQDNPDWTLTPWVKIDEPLNDPSFATNVTADYADLNNDDFWTKTHFGALVGKTVGTDYERGDNIYYQGKHYVYVSHLSSSDPTFTANSGDDGVTNFEQLLMQGAVVELSMHVDTIGAGGAQDLANGVYYKPNQDLEFIDRLPGSGIVRTNSIERRTDPSMSADGILNSQDDLFYGGLNPGNDGIYGTMDDYYTTTAFSEVAKQGGHVDSDADNNKDLLDTSYGLDDFSVADFVDYIQTIANFRAMNGGTMSRLDYASQMLDENRVNLEAAYGRIMDADIATESSRLAQQNVLLQAGAAMVTQANQMNNIVLQLLQ
jgi:flagellin-like hook-associated protein FlgL